MSKILLVAIGLAAAPAGAQSIIPTMPTEPSQAIMNQNFERSTALQPLNVTSGPAFDGQDYMSPARRAKLAKDRAAKSASAAAAKAAAAKPPAQ